MHHKEKSNKGITFTYSFVAGIYFLELWKQLRQTVFQTAQIVKILKNSSFSYTKVLQAQNYQKLII